MRSAAREVVGCRRLAAKQRLGIGIAPRLVRDAAKRKPGLGDRAVLDLKRHSDCDEREGVGQAVAQLQVGVALVKRSGGSSTATMISSRRRLVSISGVSPGRR